MAKALDFGQGLIFVSLLKKKYTELSRDSRFDSWRDRVFNLFCSLCCRFCSLFFFLAAADATTLALLRVRHPSSVGFLSLLCLRVCVRTY